MGKVHIACINYSAPTWVWGFPSCDGGFRIEKRFLTEAYALTPPTSTASPLSPTPKAIPLAYPPPSRYCQPHLTFFDTNIAVLKKVQELKVLLSISYLCQFARNNIHLLCGFPHKVNFPVIYKVGNIIIVV